jgi:hypothetical protein
MPDLMPQRLVECEDCHGCRRETNRGEKQHLGDAGTDSLFGSLARERDGIPAQGSRDDHDCHCNQTIHVSPKSWRQLIDEEGDAGIFAVGQRGSRAEETQ